MNRTNLPSGVLISSHQIELLEKRDTSEDIHLLSPEKMEQASPSCTDSSNKCSSLFMLLSPELARSTLLLWVVFFGNAFSYYGLVLLTTELNNGHNKCTVTEVQSKASQDVNYADVFITSFAEFPGLILSACIVDKFGRKLSMSAMFFLCCIFLFPLLFHQAPGLTTGLLFGARICITATFTIVYIYAPEIYPTTVRTTGVGLASSVGRVGGMVCPLVAVGLIHGCHQTVAIVLFEIVVFISGTCVLFFPFETKGRELSDKVIVQNK
ncbi:hypothetical protein Vadar_014220 [Vaccinium darrowii]|uniref:Uncharacterized protein n=1 Tax=Vaccinium darrowii TaxID=229202 RepID=A0ACB7XHG2_9ERIC|nr:hypothetical protein Vadar_014220 [Vaccinium darrowii]